MKDWINNYPGEIFGYKIANRVYNEISLQGPFTAIFFTINIETFTKYGVLDDSIENDIPC